MSDLVLEIQRLREENARLAGEVKALRMPALPVR